MLSCPVLHFYQVSSKYSEGYSSYRADMKSNSNRRRGDNPKSKTVRIVILVCNTSSHPVLHFYLVKSKYSKWYWSYRADTKSNSNTRRRDNSKSKKARVIILVRNRWSRPLLHFYQVSSKYSEGYSCYVVDMKSNSNTRRGDNSKSKKPKDVILVCDTLSRPVLYFYQVS